MTRLYEANVLKKYTYPKLEVLGYGGAKCNKHVVEKFRRALPHVLVLNGYGELAKK